MVWICVCAMCTLNRLYYWCSCYYCSVEFPFLLLLFHEITLLFIHIIMVFSVPRLPEYLQHCASDDKSGKWKVVVNFKFALTLILWFASLFAFVLVNVIILSQVNRSFSPNANGTAISWITHLNHFLLQNITTICNIRC